MIATQERTTPMEFGIFNLMGSREADKPTAQVFGEVAEQTRRADELGYTTAWFAEHHFSNYCLCASPLMLVAHCASITNNIRLGTAVVVLPLYNPARLVAEIATADALTFETCSSGTGDLEAIGEIVTGKKVVIGVIDHHTLQIERPDQVADIIRAALKHISAERVVISSDCGMGREGMGRRHAQYKMVAMVLGTNIVRRELVMPEAECLAADPRYSLAR